MAVDILNVLKASYRTELTTQGDINKGHWLLKPDQRHPLYSQSKNITGAEVIEQITQMQLMIDNLTAAQARLIHLISE